MRGYDLFLTVAAAAVERVVLEVVLAVAALVVAITALVVAGPATATPPSPHNVTGTATLTALHASGYVQPVTLTIMGVTSLALNQPLPATILVFVNVGTERLGIGVPVGVYVGR